MARKRDKERERARKRVATPSTANGRKCSIFDCRKPARAATDKGLGGLCTDHLQHWRRHGHPTRKSLSAAELSPYRWAAVVWINANTNEPYVANALERIRTRLSHAGAVIEAHETRGLSAAQRANAVLSRIRHREISPMVLLAIALGVEACLSEDKSPPRGREFARVQYAKALSRLAGGFVYKWKLAKSDNIHRTQTYAYSGGPVLRHLGKALEACCELVTDYHLGDIIATKQELEAKGRKAMRTRPYPQRFENVKRAAPLHVRGEETSAKLEPREIREVATPSGNCLTIVRL